jgi:hypothetical protein
MRRSIGVLKKCIAHHVKQHPAKWLELLFALAQVLLFALRGDRLLLPQALPVVLFLHFVHYYDKRH